MIEKAKGRLISRRRRGAQTMPSGRGLRLTPAQGVLRQCQKDMIEERLRHLMNGR
jgi:hypothetical protein